MHNSRISGVRTILSAYPLWKICGEADNGREAVVMVRELKPDLLILDISMPALNGIDAAREIRQIALAIKIIILTMHESAQLESAALQAGADAVLTKRMAASWLAIAIDRIIDLAQMFNWWKIQEVAACSLAKFCLLLNKLMALHECRNPFCVDFSNQNLGRLLNKLLTLAESGMYSMSLIVTHGTPCMHVRPPSNGKAN